MPAQFKRSSAQAFCVFSFHSIRKTQMAKQLSPWTDELVQKVTGLWQANISAREISNILAREDGLFFSRNSVCGKLMRLGLLASKGPRPPKPTIVRSRQRRPQPLPPLPPGVKMVAPTPFVPRVVEAAPRHLSLFDLGEGECRYECSGADNPADFTFCGNYASRGSYCRTHGEICFVTPKPQPRKPLYGKRAA